MYVLLLLLRSCSTCIVVVNHSHSQWGTILLVKHWYRYSIRDTTDLQLIEVFFFGDEEGGIRDYFATRVGLAGQTEAALHADRVDGELAHLLLLGLRRVSRSLQTVQHVYFFV